MQVMLGLNNVITTFQTGINCCYLLSPDIGKNYLDIQLVATLLHFHGFITSPLNYQKRIETGYLTRSALAQSHVLFLEFSILLQTLVSTSTSTSSSSPGPSSSLTLSIQSLIFLINLTTYHELNTCINMQVNWLLFYFILAKLS